jgi:hypothetical protein
LGIAQAGSKSRKLQTIAVAIARFACFVFNKLANRFIHLVLDVVGEDLELTTAEQ